MSDPWTFAGRVSALGASGGVVTLVDESTFTISGRDGDVVTPSAEGLFVRDTRLLSRFELRVNGARPESLAVVSDDPFSATFVLRCPPRPGRADSTLMVFRRRYVGQGMREDVVISNFGDEPTFCAVELFVDSDFADLFAVKEGRVTDTGGDITRVRRDDELEFSYRRGTVSRGLIVRFFPEPAVVAEDLVTFESIVPAHGSWTACLELHPVIEGKAVDPRYLCGQPVDRAAPAERLAKWRRQVPQVETDHEVLEAVIASLKVAVTVAFTATPVAPLAGVAEVTVGGVGGADVLPHPARKSAVEANKQANAYRMRTPFEIERR